MSDLEILDYAGLKQVVALYLNREDLTDQIPLFIAQATAKFNRAFTSMQIADMETYFEGSFNGSFFTLPDGFLSEHTLVIGLTWGQGNPPIEFVTESEANYRRTQQQGSCPRWYTIFTNTAEVVPGVTEDTSYVLRYYGKIFPMSADGDNNWLLLKHPDLYVVASCLQAELYLKNDPRVATWKQQYGEAMLELQAASDAARFPQGKINQRVRGY